MKSSLLGIALAVLCVGCAPTTTTRPGPNIPLGADMGGGGLASAPSNTPSTRVPAHVQRFITELEKGSRAPTAGWISVTEAREYAEATTPALAGALGHEHTYAAARKLLLDMGPVAAPHLRRLMDRHDPATPLAARQQTAIRQILQQISR